VDDSGKHLTEAMDFHKDDESWRCNSKDYCPMLSPTSPLKPDPRQLSLNAELPASASEMGRVLAHHVVQLETIVIRSSRVLLTIRCLNLAFRKRISVRYSFDHWQTMGEVDATYSPTTHDNTSDRFSVSLDCPELASFALEFAICYEVEGRRYWDNNGGQNYLAQGVGLAKALLAEAQLTVALASSPRLKCKPILRSKSLNSTPLFPPSA